MTDRLEHWLEFARWAPSADNGQPWHVVRWTESERKISARVEIPSAYRSVVKLDQAMAELGLGCFVQSLILASQDEGFVARVTFGRFGADLELSRAQEKGAEPIAGPLLLRRRTSRRPFERISLTPEELRDLRNALSRVHVEEVFLEVLDKNRGASVLRRTDAIRYQNKYHFQKLVQSLKAGSESGGRVGLRPSELEIPSVGALSLRLVSRFPASRVLFHAGLQIPFSYWGCEALIRDSGGLFFLGLSQEGPGAWFSVGRLLLSSWIEATRLGLAFQPFGHAFIFFDASTQPERFSARHRREIALLKSELRKLGLKRVEPGVFFRLGRARSETLSRVGRKSVEELRSEVPR